MPISLHKQPMPHVLQCSVNFHTILSTSQFLSFSQCSLKFICQVKLFIIQTISILKMFPLQPISNCSSGLLKYHISHFIFPSQISTSSLVYFCILLSCFIWSCFHYFHYILLASLFSVYSLPSTIVNKLSIFIFFFNYPALNKLGFTSKHEVVESLSFELLATVYLSFTIHMFLARF